MNQQRREYPFRVSDRLFHKRPVDPFTNEIFAFEGAQPVFASRRSGWGMKNDPGGIDAKLPGDISRRLQSFDTHRLRT